MSNPLPREIFPEFDKEWDDLNPLTSPLLAEHGKLKNRQMREALEIARRRAYGVREAERIEAETEERNSSGKGGTVEAAGRADRLLAAVNIAVLPFHHLIVFEHLAPALDSVPAKQKKTSSSLHQPTSLMSSQERRDLLRRSLAESDEFADEAQLLDEPIGCHFTGYSGEAPFEVDWRVLSRDSLEGCAEIYLAEMFLVKRTVYEADEDLRVSLELRSADLLRYLPFGSFAPVSAETFDQLFLNNLASSFTLNITGVVNDAKDEEIKNRADANQAIGKPVENVGQVLTDSTSRATQLGNRVESRMSMNAEDESVKEREEYKNVAGGQSAERDRGVDGNWNNEGHESNNVIHRLRLSDYWLDWQRAARLSGFDFNRLQNVGDARAVRFYELTKLWRVTSPVKAGEKLADHLEIEYETFAASMPVPVLGGERKIKRQIESLLEPLIEPHGGDGKGYVESFAVHFKTLPATNDSTALLVFRFND